MWPFDQNNQQMYQKYANAWDQGDYSRLPEHEVQQNYRQFIQNAPPPIVEQAHQQYYEQMDPQQRGGLFERLLNTLTQWGLHPIQAGIQNTDPYSMSPSEGARLTSYVQQQQPDLLHQIMGPGGPLGATGAKLAVAGVTAFLAKHLLSGGGRNF